MSETLRRIRYFLAAALVLAAASGFCPCGAQDKAGAKVTSIRIGFDGKYKVGAWTPVWVAFKGGDEQVSGQIVLIANDADGVPVRYLGEQEQAVIPAGGETIVLRYARFGRLHGELTVQLSSDERLLATRTFSAGDLTAAEPSSAEIFVTVGPPIGMEEALASRRGQEGERRVAATISRSADLPDRWWGYEGVTALCLLGSQTDLIAQLSAEQFAALETWVRLGGRLVLSVGEQGETLLGPEGRLAVFNPGRFVEVIEQRRTADLERYAGASQALVNPSADATPLNIAVLADLRFKEEAAEGSGAARRPTVVRFPLGLGQVVLTTIDLDRPPVADWPGRAKLIARLLQTSAQAREQGPDEGNLGQLTHVGFVDLGGQLRGALDQFADAPLFSFSWAAGLLLVYIVLIGPADYFFLRRITRRMELTWLTLPLVVLTFCLAAALLARAWKGDQTRLNQVNIVDLEMESGLARGTSWANLYTPRTREFDLEFKTVLPLRCEPQGVLFGWHGLTGKGLGGMDRAGGVDGGMAFSMFDRPYSTTGGQGESAVLAGVPVQAAGTKSFVARWWSQAEVASPGGLLADADGRLQGELTNPLTVDLLDGVLFHESSAYRLKTRLGAGERLAITSQLQVVNAERRLTQRRIVDAGERKVPWDAESFDISRILEIMMFYDAAGGETYTGLAHRQQPYIDLSGHLKTGRAVLLARAEESPGQITQAGEPVAAGHTQQYTFYRLVFPVGQKGRVEGIP